MKYALSIFVAAALIAPAAFANTDTPMKAGIDFSMPYALKSEGTTINRRANINMGVDGRYDLTEAWNIGARLGFDVEKRSGTNRQISLAPGTQYHWKLNDQWMPFVRADLPVVLKGAVTSTTSKNKADIGISGGLGMAWNLGEAIGVQNLLVRYDFDVSYMFGMGGANNLTSLEFFKIGFDYRF